MRSFIFFSALCLVIGWSFGESSSARTYTYGDSSGNRYGGTYGLNDGAFAGVGYFPSFMESFWTGEEFFSNDYFNNLEILLREAFESNLENQRRAFTAARKAFDLTSNQAGYMHNFPTRYNNHGLGGFGAFPGFPMSGPGINSAFAGGSIGPGFTHQVAAINPKNPKVHNVNVMSRFSDTAKEGDKDFYSVSSSSFVTSSNVDGKEKSHRKAETVVNRNGEITQYKVED